MHYILAVGRNCQESFPLYREFVQILISSFPDTKAFFYENNSEDSTPRLLKEFSYVCPSFQYKSETITLEEERVYGKAIRLDYSSNRMANISRARNILLDWIEPMMNDSDLILWIDLDMPRLPLMDLLIHWIRNFPPNVDALFANGTSMNGRYFDAFAYNDEVYPFALELAYQDRFWGEKYRYIQKPFPIDAPFRKVFSAFGGLAIYRAGSIRGCRYSGVPTEDYDWYAHYIIKKYPESPMVQWILSNQPKQQLHGANLGVWLFGKDDIPKKLFYYNCNDYNFPTICEHMTLHASMIRKGHDQLFICPSLVYFSDHWAIAD